MHMQKQMRMFTLLLGAIGSISLIVTPMQVATRRRRRLALAGALAVVLVVTGAGVLYCHEHYPGMIESIVNVMKNQFGRILG